MATKNTKKIIDLANLRELQVNAYFSFYLQKLGEDNIKDIQQRTTFYAQTLARSLIKENEEFFKEENNRRKIYYQASLLHADKKHSGHRFWEEFYDEVKAYEKQLAEEEKAKKLEEENKKKEKYADIELEEDDKYCNV